MLVPLFNVGKFGVTITYRKKMGLIYYLFLQRKFKQQKKMFWQSMTNYTSGCELHGKNNNYNNKLIV